MTLLHLSYLDRQPKFHCGPHPDDHGDGPTVGRVLVSKMQAAIARK